MKRRLFLAATAVSVLLLDPVLAAAEPAEPYPAIAVTGQVQHSESLHLQDLQKLPQTTVQVSFMTAHGTEASSYTGPLLIEVLTDAGVISSTAKNSKLRHIIMVSGSDGYSVALSMGELDPEFEGKSVVLAVSKDGSPLQPSEGVRLIVPNDRRGGRSVKQVVSVDVR